jgi:hypothetical protein
LFFIKVPNFYNTIVWKWCVIRSIWRISNLLEKYETVLKIMNNWDDLKIEFWIIGDARPIVAHQDLPIWSDPDSVKIREWCLLCSWSYLNCLIKIICMIVWLDSMWLHTIQFQFGDMLLWHYKLDYNSRESI